ncbi:MAG: PAS domain-containing protein [Archangium sp.]|nr:PAS domain-containing protein [Archangium sp.]
MNRLLIWVWGTFVGLGSATMFLTTSITMALAVGGSAAACVWLATSKVAADSRRRLEAFVAAARGLPVTHEDPFFVREVQMEAVVHRENARRLVTLRAAFDGLPEGVWVTTADGTVLEHNATLKKLLRGKAELVGRHPREFVDSPELLGAIDAACHGGASLSLEVELAATRLCVQVSPLANAPGSTAVFTLPHA